MIYDFKPTMINKWPELKHNKEEKWVRIWDIIFKKNINKEINLEKLSKELSHQDFLVNLCKESENHLLAIVITERWGWEDNLIFANYKMLYEIEIKLGDIDTIQGQNNDLRWNIYKNLAKKQKQPD